MVDPNESQNPRGSQWGSGGILLWILAIAGIALVVCCGGVGLMAWRFSKTAATSDPDAIRAQTAEMVDIDIPDQFRPFQAMNLLAFRMIMYQTDSAPSGASGLLMLMEMAVGGNQQQEQELRKAMQQQQGNQNLQVTKTETREIEIGGELVPFEFSEATAKQQGQEQTMHVVKGVFPGKRGAVMLQLMVPDEQYDEAAVMQMLESIE